jgi:putative transposase
MPTEKIPAPPPAQLRFLLWMSFGYLLGIPVAELFSGINLQTAILQRQIGTRRIGYTIAERLRLLDLHKKLGKHLRGCVNWVASPQALAKAIKRYQERMAQVQKKSEKTKPGRLWLSQERMEAILQIYHAGCHGLSRIVGEMNKCGLPVSERTVRRVLNQHGLLPGNGRERMGSTWAQFLRLHAKQFVGLDFMQIPVGLLGKITYRFVFFAIEHDTRRVHVLGICEKPTHDWILNVLRSATAEGSPLATRKYWLHDNDVKYPRKRMQQLLKNRGMKSVPTIPYTPDMNAYAERFVRSMREECLDHIIFMDDAMLENAVAMYIRHYNTERPHQGIGNIPIGPWACGTSKLVCDRHLDGLLTSFRRAA